MLSASRELLPEKIPKLPYTLPKQVQSGVYAVSVYYPQPNLLPLQETLVGNGIRRHPTLVHAHSTSNLPAYEAHFSQAGMQAPRGNMIYGSPHSRNNWMQQGGLHPSPPMRRVMNNERRYGVNFAIPSNPSTSGTYGEQMDGSGYF